MEFPNVGERCTVEECKQLNFLPITCSHCHDVFCEQHYLTDYHKCTSFHDNVTETKTKFSSYVCTDELCKNTSLIEMHCIKCKKHYCLKHRHHGCSEQSKEKKLKKWQVPKNQFAEAKAIVDQEISNNLKKSKNVAMANKIRLMRIKSSAVGPKNVPTNERCYFLAFSSTKTINKHLGPARGIYVNMNWTMGKVIDSIASTLKMPNNNNLENSTKLQLYHHETGAVVTKEMNTPLTKLLESSELVDGQSVILEYSDNDYVDTSLYKLINLQ